MTPAVSITECPHCEGHGALILTKDGTMSLPEAKKITEQLEDELND